MRAPVLVLLLAVASTAADDRQQRGTRATQPWRSAPGAPLFLLPAATGPDAATATAPPNATGARAARTAQPEAPAGSATTAEPSGPPGDLIAWIAVVSLGAAAFVFVVAAGAVYGCRRRRSRPLVRYADTPDGRTFAERVHGTADDSGRVNQNGRDALVNGDVRSFTCLAQRGAGDQQR